MTSGTSSWNGLGMGLFGEYQLTGINAGIDIFTITQAASQTGMPFVIENSDGTEMLRYLAYGRLRLIRTDTAQQHAYINTLDVKMDLDYAAGGVQCYAGTFILDTAGGSTSGGRGAVLHLQWYGDAGVTDGAAYSFIHCSDQGSLAEVGAFITLLRQAGTAGGCFEEISDVVATHGLILYVDNVKYWIMCSTSS